MTIDAPAARKLASIVAIDVAGYSRRSETDEEAAIQAVASLRQQIGKAAKAHGGRVFNTAGDGFMLEFPTVSGALSAAEAIAGSADPPVRVGVHLGEVFVTESGDLLGHGVNVAARIQQMASPGAVLVSGDVRRAVRGSLGERLKPQGSVRLDKMSETLPVFALTPADGGRTKGRRRDLRPWGAAAAIAACVCVLAASAWITRGLWLASGTGPTRIAVAPIDAPAGTPWLKDFAGGLSDQVLGVLSTRQIPTVSGAEAAALEGPGGDGQAKRLGVRLLIGGTARGDGANVAVDLHFEDPASHSTVWSMAFNGKQAEADGLRAQIAAKASAMLDCGSRALRPVGGLKDADALSSYLKACDVFQTSGYDFQPEPVFQLFAALRRVIAAAPDFAPARSDLAKYEAYYAHYIPFSAEQAASLRKEARAEAERALALDPKSADAYVALMFLVPRPGWAERERLLRKAIVADPEWPHGNGFLGVLLWEVGRVQEAAVYGQRASAANPLSTELGWTSESARILSASGQVEQADAILAQLSKLWPSDSDVWSSRLEVAVNAARWDEALAILKQPGRPAFIQSDEVAEEEMVFRAAKSRARDQLAAARRAVLARDKDNPALTNTGIRNLSMLGDLDDAFALASSPSAMASPDGPYQTLFSPPTRPMRLDRRFMGLAAHLGLVGYWRATGKWPDFCSEAGLPYDCKAEAAKLAIARR